MKKTNQLPGKTILEKNAHELNEENNLLSRRNLLGAASLTMMGLLLGNNSTAQQPSNESGSNANGKVTKDMLLNRSLMPKHQKKTPVSKHLPHLDTKRDAQAEQQWSKLEEELQTLAVTLNGKPDAPLNKAYLNISNGFTFETKPLDEQFLETHIEPLIDQAADLLDRCLKDRTTWDELSAKMYYLIEELTNFRETDKLHQEEETAGVYDISFKMSQASYLSELEFFNKATDVKKMLENMLTQKYSPAELDKVHNATICNSWLGGFPSFYGKGAKFVYAQHNFNGNTTTAASHYYNNTKIISQFSVDTQKFNLESQLQLLNAQLDSSMKKLEGLKAQMEWEEKNANFQKRRAIVERNAKDLLAKAAFDIDGTLNYNKRLIPLKQRFDRDFRDALARMRVVEKGLLNIYGYNYPMPKAEEAPDYYDRCLLWTREVIQWVLKFSQNEQNTILPISVKQVLGINQFNTMRESGEFEFELTEKHFPGMSNVRLRGINLHAEESLQRIWQLKITPPKESKVLQHLTSNTVTFKQHFLEPCFSGRVFSRELDRTPDLLGITSLYNASPLGKWKVNIVGSVPFRETKRIEDITIDMHLGFRWI